MSIPTSSFKITKFNREHLKDFFLAVPESCLALSTCSGITTNGEYWVYPAVTNRRLTKIYCHNLATEPSHFITLKYPNNFIIHDESNWIIQHRRCQSAIRLRLKKTKFLKVKLRKEVKLVYRILYFMYKHRWNYTCK